MKLTSKNVRSRAGAGLTVLALLGTFSANAAAYLDPGTGSILIQGAIAGIAAGAFTMRMYWYKVKAFFTGQKRASSENGPAESGTHETGRDS
jgi:hypothetical protein